MVKDKLCLGTVQFGLEYGINNKNGKPAEEQVFTMLDLAVEKGIEYFDTAAAYGNAEEILGRYFESRNLQKQVKVISKLLPNLIADDNYRAEAIVENEIRKSLERLKLECLEGYLLHTPTDFYNHSIMNGLFLAKEKGLIRNLGVSIYETEHALDVVNSGMVDYIQIPYNVFDQRMERSGFFDIARANGVTVFARSPFLQGLLFMEGDDIPAHLERARVYLHDFDEIIAQYSLKRVEAALFLSYLNPGIDYVVFGVDNIEQLTENIEVCNLNPDVDSSCIEELKQHFMNIEKEIIFPSLWARK
ncbi:MAG: aldo/keto reductase [Syntrophomonadaceae bacterium]|nr:aldo/keto reductase [Syntrophomonadaceae bacterium]